MSLCRDGRWKTDTFCADFADTAQSRENAPLIRLYALNQHLHQKLSRYVYPSDKGTTQKKNKESASYIGRTLPPEEATD